MQAPYGQEVCKQWRMQDENQGEAKNNGDVDLHEDLTVI
jgi:hypothetical protein